SLRLPGGARRAPAAWREAAGARLVRTRVREPRLREDDRGAGRPGCTGETRWRRRRGALRILAAPVRLRCRPAAERGDELAGRVVGLLRHRHSEYRGLLREHPWAPGDADGQPIPRTRPEDVGLAGAPQGLGRPSLRGTHARAA